VLIAAHFWRSTPAGNLVISDTLPQSRSLGVFIRKRAPKACLGVKHHAFAAGTGVFFRFPFDASMVTRYRGFLHDNATTFKPPRGGTRALASNRAGR
jgi:hypothetical protein